MGWKSAVRVVLGCWILSEVWCLELRACVNAAHSPSASLCTRRVPRWHMPCYGVLAMAQAYVWHPSANMRRSDDYQNSGM